MARKEKWKPKSIIKVIQHVEQCKLVACNKTKGHYMFYRPEIKSDNPHLCFNECYISYIYEPIKNEVHGLYYWVKSGNSSKRIFK